MSDPPLPTPSLPSAANPSTLLPHPSRASPPSSPTSTTSFHSTTSPTEPSSLSTALNLKTRANALLSQADYSQALTLYERALAACPREHVYDCAVIRSNMAECHIREEGWKEAVDRAGEALEGLEELDAGLRVVEEEKAVEGVQGVEGKAEEGDGKEKGVEDLETAALKLTLQESNAGAHAPAEKHAEAQQTPNPTPSDPSDSSIPASAPTPQQIRLLYYKTLYRRALASRAQQTWTTLSASQRDYTRLLALSPPPITTATSVSLPTASQSLQNPQQNPTSPSPSPSQPTSAPHPSSTSASTSRPAPLSRQLSLPPLPIPQSTQNNVLHALRELPAEIDRAQKGEMAEMWSKLKEVGDGVLRPFGLSTADFKVTQNDDGGGGVGISIDRGDKGKGNT